MNLKASTVWTYVGMGITGLLGADSYLMTQHLPSQAATICGYVGMGLAATNIFFHAFDATTKVSK